MSVKLSTHLSHSAFKRLPSDSIPTSLARIRSIQTILKEKKADCLLCIQGIDSRYNEGMQECISYILFGLFDARKEVSSLQVDEEVIDDLMICVKVDSVDVYCNPINYSYLLPYIACWPDLRIYCLSQSQYETFDDVAEEFKIQTFLSMVSDCKRVAISYFPHHQVGISEFHAMNIEQWPIIQAYALEGYGSGTFFTLAHDVLDLSAPVFSACNRFDVISFQHTLLEQHLPVFEKQWDVLNKTLDIARLNNFAEGFTETQAAESLVTYYNHGRVGRSHTVESSTSCWTNPFVYMGSETKCMEQGNQKSGDVNIINSGPTSDKALHMVCHGVAPRSGLMCTRTYFFNTSSLPPIIGDIDATGHHSADTELLSRAYRAAVEVTLQSISEYVVMLQPQQVLDEARQSVTAKLQKFTDCRKLNIEVKLECKLEDGSHQSVRGTDYQSAENGAICGRVLTMFIIISNISSPNDPNTSLGGVAYADSFLLSSIRYGSDDSNDFQFNTEVINLTQNVPRWQCWNISSTCDKQTEALESMMTGGDVCGGVLIDGQPVDLISPQAWLQAIPCSLHLYSEVLILMNTSVGPITLTKDEIKSVSFYDGAGPSVPAFAIFYTSMEFQSKLPIQLQNTLRMFIISLSPRSRAYKLFFEQVFEAWKIAEETGFVCTMEEQLPKVLEPVYDRLATEFKQQLSRPLSHLGVHNAAQSRLVGLQRFMNHLSASSCLSPDQILSHSDLSTVLRHKEIVLEERPVMLTISIISGVPGSYKENVANFITKLTQERCRWVIHKQTPETSHVFDASKLENSLSYVYNALRRKSNTGTKSSRMLIITPGYTDIQSVVGVIQNHPNKELRACITIGAVTTCIDPNNCFIAGHHTIPGLLNQCANGWVNNIVLTTSSDYAKDELLEVQNLVRAANPSVNFMVTEKGALTRSQDIELILSAVAFEQQEMRRVRILWQQKTHPCGQSLGLNTVILSLRQPLVKQQLISQLRDLHITDLGASVSPETVLYICGRCHLQGFEGMYDLTSTPVSNSTKIQVAKQGASTGDGFVSFTGFSLDEGKLKSMLRRCAPLRPQKKEYITIESMDRATKNAIHQEIHLAALPSGWFYNGSQYIDMMGERSNRHPLFNQFLQEHVDKENEAIREYNIKVDSTHYDDLFE
ncbi:dynein axonemal assembly factor 9-like [Watersipora subatra]|uniref:dynein axonemal assembly factor 9-like n=1 Tax=Watersipora subatra TaxID=2589382 RepID=UPI00355B9447